MRPPDTGIANLVDALKYASDVADPITNQLLRRALFVVIQRAYGQQIKPEGEFDAMFLAKALEKLFSQHDKLIQILNGVDLDDGF
jgi:hypothetical protein